MNFDERVEYTKPAEKRIEKYLISKGWHSLPVVGETGPQRIYFKDGSYACVDFFVFKRKKKLWIEVKRRSKALHYKKYDCYTVGMGKEYLNSYDKLQDESGVDVIVYFVVDYSEDSVPFGVFAETLDYLKDNVHSEYDGAYFWDVDDLKIVEMED